MTTSGTAVWNLEICDLIEEAYERAGLEARTGYDFRTARRSLNMISAEWSNRGLNLWTVQENTLVLTPGVKTYPLAEDTIDIIETMIRVNTSGSALDYTVSRIGVGDYATLPNKNTKEAGTRAEDLIKRTGLWDHRNKKPGELSGGESQRTAVVRALINNPAVLLADEPTGSLDHENSSQLFDMLIEFSRTDEVTLVVVTHSQELAGRMDIVYRLKSGKLDMITE